MNDADRPGGERLVGLERVVHGRHRTMPRMPPDQRRHRRPPAARPRAWSGRSSGPTRSAPTRSRSGPTTRRRGGVAPSRPIELTRSSSGWASTASVRSRSTPRTCATWPARIRTFFARHRRHPGHRAARRAVVRRPLRQRPHRLAPRQRRGRRHRPRRRGHPADAGRGRRRPGRGDARARELGRQRLGRWARPRRAGAIADAVDARGRARAPARVLPRHGPRLGRRASTSATRRRSTPSWPSSMRASGSTGW